MKTHKFVTIVILAVFLALVFVQANMITEDAQALPDNPSLDISVVGSREINFTRETSLTFEVEVEYLLEGLDPDIDAFVEMRYDFSENVTDPSFQNKTVSLNILTNKDEKLTFTIDFDEPLQLPLGNLYVVQFSVRENDKYGEIQDTDYFNVEAGRYYDFEIVDEPEIEGRDGSLKEGELIEVSVKVKNLGNSPFPAKVVLYIDDEEYTYSQETVDIGETKTIVIGWSNPEDGSYSVYVEVYAVTIDGDSELLDESDPQTVPIEADNEIPWPYWVIFGTAVIIILIIIAVIIKTNRSKGEPEPMEEEEEQEPKGKKK